MILHEGLEESVDLVAYRLRDIQIGTVVQSGCPIVGVEEIDPKSGHGKGGGFPSPWRTGNYKHSGRHLPAEIALRPVLHVFWNIGAHASPILVADTQAFQLFRRRLHTLSCGLQMRIGLRSPELRFVGRGHYGFIIFFSQDRLQLPPQLRAHPRIRPSGGNRDLDFAAVQARRHQEAALRG